MSNRNSKQRKSRNGAGSTVTTTATRSKPTRGSNTSTKTNKRIISTRKTGTKGHETIKEKMKILKEGGTTYGTTTLKTNPDVKRFFDEMIGSSNTNNEKSQPPAIPTATAVDDEFLDDAARAKLEMIQRIRAENYQTIPASEFSGKGKVLKILEMGTAMSRFKNPDGTPKKAIQLRVIDAQTNTERLWQPGQRALDKITPFIIRPLPIILHIWNYGTGVDTHYEVSDKIPAGSKEIVEDISSSSSSPQQSEVVTSLSNKRRKMNNNKSNNKSKSKSKSKKQTTKNKQSQKKGTSR